MSGALTLKAVVRSVVDVAVVVVAAPMAATVSPHHHHPFRFNKMTDLTGVQRE